MRYIPELSRLKAGDILTDVTKSQQGPSCTLHLIGTPLGKRRFERRGRLLLGWADLLLGGRGLKGRYGCLKEQS